MPTTVHADDLYLYVLSGSYSCNLLLISPTSCSAPVKSDGDNNASRCTTSCLITAGPRYKNPSDADTFLWTEDIFKKIIIFLC